MAQPSTIYKPGKLNYLWNYLGATLDIFKAKLLGYRTYKAALTQSGTNPPVATVLENTLGIQVTYEYSDAGVYYALINKSLFDSPTMTIDGRTVEVTITPSYSYNSPGLGDTEFTAYPVFFFVVGIGSYSALTGTDDLLGAFCSTTLEIKVYN